VTATARTLGPRDLAARLWTFLTGPVAPMDLPARVRAAIATEQA